MTELVSVQVKPRKLLFVVTEDWYFISHRLSLAIAAKDDGYQVIVATRIADGADKIRRAGIGLRSIEFDRGGLNPLSDLRTLMQLMQLYRDERPDIVHHVALKPVLLGSIAAKLCRVKGVVNALGGLGYIFSSSTARARILRTLIRPLLAIAMRGKRSLTIVQNADDRDQLVTKNIVKRRNIRLIRGVGVDMAKYGSSTASASEPLVILPARLLRDKGVNEFVAAATYLKLNGALARFALVGKADPNNPACVPQADIDAWAKDGNVEIWGWQDDMPRIFSESQIVCLPSYHEGFPLALLEAAASSCAIIASDIAGCRALITPGETGWLVKPKDVDSLIEVLTEAIGNPDLRGHFGRQVRERTRKLFSAPIIAKETIAVYKELEQ